MEMPGHSHVMTRGEKIATHVIFGIGVIMFVCARLMYLREQEKGCATMTTCKEICCAGKTNVVATGSSKTNKPNGFMQGLKSGFEKGLEAGKEKGKE